MAKRLLISGAAVIGVVIVGFFVSRSHVPPTSRLTALDRGTGREIWSKSLDRSGAQWMWQEGERLVVATCWNEHVELLINPTNGSIVGSRDQFAFGSEDPDAFGGAGVPTRADGPRDFGLATAEGLSYDKDASLLVSDNRWSTKVDVSGPDWIPALIRPDIVYVVENAGECNGFD